MEETKEMPVAVGIVIPAMFAVFLALRIVCSFLGF